MIKVSVLIPAYNLENFIENSILSCINQTLHDIEVIVVNDGSIDNTPQKIQRLCSLYQNVFLVNKINGGVTSARIEAIKKARGEYITFLDGDDSLPNNALELLYKEAKEKSCDIVFGDISNTDFAGNLVKNIHYGNLKLALGNDLLRWILKNRVGYLFGKIIRKEIFEKIDFSLAIELTFCEDLICMIQAANLAKKVKKIDYPVYNYIIRESSVCHTKVSKCVLINRYEKLIEKLLILKKNISMTNEIANYFDRLILFYINIFVWLSGSYNGQNFNYREIYKDLFIKNKAVRTILLDESPRKYFLTIITFLFPSLSSKIYLFFIKYYLKRI